MGRRLAAIIFLIAAIAGIAFPCAQVRAASGIAIGVNVPEIVWKSPQDQNEEFSQIAQAQVGSIRVGWTEPQSRMIPILQAAKARNICVLIVFQAAFSGTPRPKSRQVTHPTFGMSQIQFDATRQRVDDILSAVAQTGVAIDGLEFENEIDMAGFNGDLPVNDNGKGFYIQDLAQAPPDVAQRVAAGFKLYGDALRLVRTEVSSHPTLNGTPIISAGLAGAEKSWSISSGVSSLSFDLALKLLAANGVFQLSDGFGLHVYSGLFPAVGSVAKSLSITSQALKICGSNAVGRLPCWITEYGSHLDAQDCDRGASIRGQLVGAFDQMALGLGQSRIRALYFFSWAQTDGSALFRCGSLSATGHVFTGH